MLGGRSRDRAGNRSPHAETELRDECVECRRLACQRMACRRLLFHHGGVLLRALIDGVHGRTDLVETRGLFARRAHDRRDIDIDFLNLIDDLAERRARLTDERDTEMDLLARFGDEGLDLLGREPPAPRRQTPCRPRRRAQPPPRHSAPEGWSGRRSRRSRR
jgi:hypothetical protein